MVLAAEVGLVGEVVPLEGLGASVGIGMVPGKGAPRFDPSLGEVGYAENIGGIVGISGMAEEVPVGGKASVSVSSPPGTVNRFLVMVYGFL